MAEPLVKNNAYSLLATLGCLSGTGTSGDFTVTGSTGSRFPILSGGDWFYATLQDAANNIEIIKVSARTTDTFTCSERGLESTAPRAWGVGDVIEVRMTAGTVVTVDGTQTLTKKTLTAPVLTTPTLGVATATTINKVAITQPATGSTLTVADGKTLTASNSLTLAGTDGTTMTFPTTTAVVARTDAAQTFTGVQTFTAPVLGTPTSGNLTNCTVPSASWPVGSIYMSVVATNPNTLFGFGTWAVFGAGRMPISLDAGNALFDTAEETGGTANAVNVAHSHTVTDPGHVHAPAQGSVFYGNLPATTGFGTTPSPDYVGITGSTTASAVTNLTVDSAGVSGTNANYPPFIAVYMWKRTA